MQHTRLETLVSPKAKALAIGEPKPRTYRRPIDLFLPVAVLRTPYGEILPIYLLVSLSFHLLVNSFSSFFISFFIFL